MSNEYALFMILLPNDFDKEISLTPVTSHIIKTTTSTVSVLTYFFFPNYRCFTSHPLVQYLL
jgi:hypothetical protein